MKSSLFDIFKVGLGPSSSHTVGPMKAARQFVTQLPAGELTALQVHLYGSLALTGKGHATDVAVQLGLLGETPDQVDVEAVASLLQGLHSAGRLVLPDGREVPFQAEQDIVFHLDESLPGHPNALRLVALGPDGTLSARVCYSVGGGAVQWEGEETVGRELPLVPHPFQCADELLSIGDDTGLAIWEIAWNNELAWHRAEEIDAWLNRIWDVMQECVRRGLGTEGTLPGGLQVNRRASALRRKLEARSALDPLTPLDWVDAFAMAVNEENAAGGRVVTAPTNGAAGVIPAVAHYYRRFVPDADELGLKRFFLTAATIGLLYKENASISGADVGCQGEVGVASSMAAGGLVAAQGGSNRCVEKAAEIAMEHNLGMTCDPVGGLVQIPCIERNAMGAVKAINASRIAMLEGGAHKVSLDKVIATMLQTGKDMRSQYKETSLGGLAVSVPLC